MKSDPGYFGPNSMMWEINKEITVLFGGARALLMHAAHPLIAAGARQTSFYQRDPWKRLIRTLSLQNSVTFGTRQEADDSATRINRLHEVIKERILLVVVIMMLLIMNSYCGYMLACSSHQFTFMKRLFEN